MNSTLMRRLHRGHWRRVSFRMFLALGVAGPALAAHAANPNSKIDVAPPDSIRFSTVRGQSPAPNYAVITLTNSGRGAVRWSAGTDTRWIHVTPNCGMILPHRQSTLIARLGDVSLFRAGHFSGTLGVTNLSGDDAPILRAVILQVNADGSSRLPAPRLEGEPVFTAGTTNSVAWTRVPQANEYRVQASRRSDFSEPMSSGWMAHTQHVFSGLVDGATYFYRVQSRSNSTAWSQTLADQFSANENHEVSTQTQPGDIVLSGNDNRIWIEDFERGGPGWTNTIFNDLSRGMPSSAWEVNPIAPETFAAITEPPIPISAGGDQEGRLSNVNAYHRYAFCPTNRDNILGDVTVDAYVALDTRQPYYNVAAGIVLRGDPLPGTGFLGGSGVAAYLQADASNERMLNILSLSGGILTGGLTGSAVRFPVEDPEENYHLRFTARGPQLTVSAWRIRARQGVLVESPIRLGNGTNQVTVQDWTKGPGVVGLMGIAWNASAGAPVSACFDDVTIVAEEVPPHYSATGTSIATVTPPPWFERWGRLDFTTEGETDQTSVTVDILDAKSRLLERNVRRGSDLGSMASLQGLATLRLRANLSTQVSSKSAALSDWTVTYASAEENASTSDWSNVASSTQDSVPPVLEVTGLTTNRITVSNATLRLIGKGFDAVSGVSGVRAQAIGGFDVRTVEAASTNGYSDWTLELNLRPGISLVRILARDNAVPANITSVAITVTLVQPSPGANPTAVAGTDAPNTMPLPTTPPALRLDFQDDSVVVSWDAAGVGWILQSATALNPPDWTDMSPAPVNSLVTGRNGPRRFYRLRHE